MLEWIVNKLPGRNATPSRSSGPSQFTAIGNTEAICPYCGSRLDKKPGRKKKCPKCSKPIYIRTRPLDNQKVLVTEEQAEAIKEQWSIANGTHDNYLAERHALEEKRVHLARQLGREPGDNEVQWSLLSNEMQVHAKNGDWGLFRNARFQMAEVLQKESKPRDALALYLEVCYLDLNGPNNTGSGGFFAPRVPAAGERDPLIRQMFPPFEPDDGLLAPGVLVRMSRLVEQLGISAAETKKMFDLVARSLRASLRLPLNPEPAWKQIEAELFG